MGEWTRQAACAGKPTEWWFPEKNRLTAPRVLGALRLCVLCPVRRQCLQEAMEIPETMDYGIRGGLYDAERRTARRERSENFHDIDGMLKKARLRAIRKGLVKEEEVL